ncbi:MAG: phosphohydrolase [Paenibacillus sp.]|jgi:predicted HD superfamily hydrolase involved in NAD metabolism|nr:phosphohydrolase [Paenibacillus sp.]
MNLDLSLEELIKRTQEQMPTRRWDHTQGVRTTAVMLADRFGGDPKLADLAALLHDYCKYWPIDKQVEAYKSFSLSSDVLAYDPQLLHGPLAAAIAEAEFGITDQDVLGAIRYHTSGRAGMTLLEKIVCLADYMEPGRDFPEVAHIREKAEHNLDKALLAGFDSTIGFLLNKGKKIYPLTLSARNGLIDEIHAQRTDRS